MALRWRKRCSALSVVYKLSRRRGKSCMYSDRYLAKHLATNVTIIGIVDVEYSQLLKLLP